MYHASRRLGSIRSPPKTFGTRTELTQTTNPFPWGRFHLWPLLPQAKDRQALDRVESPTTHPEPLALGDGGCCICLPANPPSCPTEGIRFISHQPERGTTQVSTPEHDAWVDFKQTQRTHSTLLRPAGVNSRSRLYSISRRSCKIMNGRKPCCDLHSHHGLRTMPTSLGFCLSRGYKSSEETQQAQGHRPWDTSRPDRAALTRPAVMTLCT